MFTWQLIITIIIYSVEICNSLECYVCFNQENNFDKCVTTIETCDHSQDRCLSFIRWGSTPYWAPTGEKQFYLSKACANKKKCDDAFHNVSRRCDRIWYNDWECAECCYGDRCNYYVTLSGPSVRGNLVSAVCATIISLWFIKLVYL